MGTKLLLLTELVIFSLPLTIFLYKELAIGNSKTVAFIKGEIIWKTTELDIIFKGKDFPFGNVIIDYIIKLQIRTVTLIYFFLKLYVNADLR